MAKLLKDKGFNEGCRAHYDSASSFSYEKYEVETSGCEMHNAILAPTFQMVIKWLRSQYSIIIVVDYDYEYTNTSYCYKIYRLEEHGRPKRVPIKGTSYNKDNEPIEHIIGYRDYERSKSEYSTYEEACEAAIKYCLDNLI